MNAGILLPLSGEYEKEGNNILSGIMAETNESGSGIEYLVRDTGGDPQGAPEIAVWTGSPVNGSEAVKTIREYSRDTKIILSESSANDLFTENAGSYAEGVYGIEYPGGLSEDTMYEYYGRDTAMVLEEALAEGADTIPEIREELDSNIVTGYTGIKYFRDGSSAPPYYIIIKVENGTWVKDNEYSARLMAGISAVYGGALEFDPLLNDDHARLPLPHGIYD